MRVAKMDQNDSARRVIVRAMNKIKGTTGKSSAVRTKNTGYGGNRMRMTSLGQSD